MPSGSQDVANYLDSAKRQRREYYHRLPLDKMRCYCCNALAMTMSHAERNPGRLFFSCSRRLCPFFKSVDEDPGGKNRAWLEEDKFICLFDGRIVKRTFRDVMTETPPKEACGKPSTSIWVRSKVIGNQTSPPKNNWSWNKEV